MNYELKKMESKEGNDALFLHATEGILVTNSSGQIIRINPSAEHLFGYEHGELAGMKIEALIPRRFTQKHETNRTSYAHHPHARSMGLGMDLFGLKKDGSEFPVEISLSPYSNKDGNFVIAFIIDITLRKEAEFRMKTYFADLEKQVKNRTLVLEEAIAELEKTKRDLDISLAKEKELNEMKSRFVSMASHEFRTPLTTMMSSVSLISKYHERKDDGNHQKHVSKVKISINNLTDILNDFLSVSKLEEGKIVNEPEEMNIRIFISEIVSEMRTMLFGKQVISEDYLGEELVRLDPKILKNVLLNLFSNAIKFSSQDGVIELSVRKIADEIFITVKDHGIGISKEDQEQLFERFFRGKNATHIQGTGLGLSIVARYIELMNGTIEIESVQNEGTKVTLSIKDSKTNDNEKDTSNRG
ncbi:PAS domain-containing sensor histidine kinase [Fluviicola taffensis]|nr:PAS domain-containing sensor histidine kinase [Fluviicola taffensis]